MAIIVEGITVVFPFDLTRTKYQGGWAQFKEDMPKERVRYCSDQELIGILFKPEEETLNRVSTYLDTLEKRGLTITKGNEFSDVAVLDQLLDLPEGMKCPWLTIYTAVAGVPEKPARFDFSYGQGVAPEELLAPLEDVGKIEAKAEREALAAEQERIRKEIKEQFGTPDDAEVDEKAEDSESPEGVESAEEVVDTETAETDDVTAADEETESAEEEVVAVAAMAVDASDDIVSETEALSDIATDEESAESDVPSDDESAEPDFSEKSEAEGGPAREIEPESLYEELSEEELEKLPRVKACRLNNGTSKGLSLPKDWDYEKSWTKLYGIVPPETPFVPVDKL